MTEETRKHVDEDWKARVDQEKAQPAPAAAAPAPPAGSPDAAAAMDARFDIFISGLSMEALIALGDLPHPTTKKRGLNLPQAKYLIDLLGVLEEKTRNNLTPEESQLLTDLLYQLRMRYLSQTPAT